MRDRGPDSGDPELQRLECIENIFRNLKPQDLMEDWIWNKRKENVKDD